MTEEFRPIAGYEGLYEINNLGEVFRCENIDYRKHYGKIRPFKVKRIKLKPSVRKKDGYVNVFLFKDRVKKTYFLHRLVALTFIPNPDNKPEVNHKDKIRTNCLVSNLEWATPLENSQHSWKSGDRKATPIYGEGQGIAKLKNAQVLKIRELYATGRYKYRELAPMFGVSRSAIGGIVRRKYWPHI